MSYTIKYGLDLGPGRAGLTLAARLVDDAGNNSGNEITGGILEIGGGFYKADISVPDDFSGGIKFYQSGIPATILKFAVISPYELEALTRIRAKTDNLPAQPAAVGSAMTLASAYDAAKTAAQAGDAMTLTQAYDAAKTAAQAGDAMTLESGERNSIAAAALDLANAIDGKTLRQALQIIAAVLAGKVSGAGSGTETFRGLDDGATRVVVTADALGNRTNVTYP